MSKLAVFGLPRLERVIETRSFRDEAADETLTLTLRYPTAPEQSRASEISAGLIRDYITGDESIGRAAGPFPAADIEPSETLFRTAAMLCVMQCPENPADAYTALELSVLSDRTPLAWSQALSWYLELMRGGAAAWGKSPGAPTASSAAPRSNTPATTP